ncbi:MAG TPA: hypothetical protein DC017_15565 [Candidatus Wallbacteria bacterium]|nr:hypothetical protein [Candidatus Wallbacteria bacterium]
MKVMNKMVDKDIIDVAEKDNVNNIISFFIMMFLVTVSFSTFLSNFALYSAITALLYSRAVGGSRPGFKYDVIYTAMLLFVAANIAGLFTSGLGLAKIGRVKNVMAFLAFFLAFEKGALLIDKLRMLFVLQTVNFVLLVTAIISTALNLTDILYFQDFVNWPSKYSGLFEVAITYGEFLVMMQCVSISVVLGAKDAFESVRSRGLFLALIAANMFALVLTYSRGPWLVMTLTIGFILLLNQYYKTLAAFAGIVVLSLMIIICPPVKNNAFLNELNARVMSTLGGYSSGREVIYAVAFKMIADHPLTGVGIGGVEKNYSDYVKRVEWAPAERKDMVYGHLHNLYLQVYAEAGILGFASFMWLCALVLFALASKALKRAAAFGPLERAYTQGAFCAFAAVMIMGLSEYNMFNNEISRILWFYAGTALASRPAETDGSSKPD